MSDKKEVANDFREVLSADDPHHNKTIAVSKFKDFKEKWRKQYRTFGRYLDNLDIYPYLTFLDYDVRIRRMLYTTNWIERFNKSARRTLKIRGALPSEEAVLSLITSVAKEQTEGHYSYPIYNFRYEEQLLANKY